MVAGPEVMHQVVPMLEASFRRCPVRGVEEVVVGVGVSSPPLPVDSQSQVDLEVPDLVSS
uniref:Uncharacterized protein n=1 Tax=Aegilops tauschii subsp. strangulata TaxID=200361 RepID=A0A453JWR0_AEGTS